MMDDKIVKRYIIKQGRFFLDYFRNATSLDSYKEMHKLFYMYYDFVFDYLKLEADDPLDFFTSFTIGIDFKKNSLESASQITGQDITAYFDQFEGILNHYRKEWGVNKDFEKELEGYQERLFLAKF